MREEDEVKGMIVYDRTNFRRGIITNANMSTGMVVVKWEDLTVSDVRIATLMSEKLYQENREKERLEKIMLKPEEAMVGSTVYAISTVYPLMSGKIVGPLNDGFVIVEWSDGRLVKQNLQGLLSQDAGIAENKRLMDEEHRLEAEFSALQDACNDRLQRAANLILEAATLANNSGQSLQDIADTGLLEDAMADAGWSTSSWYC